MFRFLYRIVKDEVQLRTVLRVTVDCAGVNGLFVRNVHNANSHGIFVQECSWATNQNISAERVGTPQKTVQVAVECIKFVLIFRDAVCIGPSVD